MSKGACACACMCSKCVWLLFRALQCSKESEGDEGGRELRRNLLLQLRDREGLSGGDLPSLEEEEEEEEEDQEEEEAVVVKSKEELWTAFKDSYKKQLSKLEVIGHMMYYKDVVLLHKFLSSQDDFPAVSVATMEALHDWVSGALTELLQCTSDPITTTTTTTTSSSKQCFWEHCSTELLLCSAVLAQKHDATIESVEQSRRRTSE